MTRGATLVLVTVISSASALASSETSQQRCSIFVRSAQAAGGFTDPSKDRQDSVKDLVNKLKDSKALQIVESEKDALLLLEVLERETKRETNLMGRQNKSYLTVRLTAGEYTTEFTGESGSKGVLKGYGAAAGKVVKQLEAWVEANREKLLALKSPAAAGTSTPSTPTP